MKPSEPWLNPCQCFSPSSDGLPVFLPRGMRDRKTSFISMHLSRVGGPGCPQGPYGLSSGDGRCLQGSGSVIWGYFQSSCSKRGCRVQPGWLSPSQEWSRDRRHREATRVGGVLASLSFYYQDLPTASQNSRSFTEGWWRSVFQRYHQGARRPLWEHREGWASLLGEEQRSLMGGRRCVYVSGQRAWGPAPPHAGENQKPGHCWEHPVGALKNHAIGTSLWHYRGAPVRSLVRELHPTCHN